MNLKSGYRKVLSILILLFILILPFLNLLANERIVERRIQKLDDATVRIMSGYFMENFSNDQVLKDFIKFINSVVSTVTFEDDIEKGCLELKLTNVYKLYGQYFYELSCDCCGWYCQNFPTEDKSGCILVYVDKKGRLVRINDNISTQKSNWEIGKKDKAIKALESFLKERGIKPITEKKETLADIFISLICLSNVGKFPQKVEFISEKTQGDKAVCDFMADYGFMKCQYTFIFDSSNRVLSAKCNCYGGN